MQIAEDILSMPPETVPDYILQHANARTLSGVVKTLNSHLLEGDATARRLAHRALDRLGFMIAD
jgi:hypothetical protein